MRIISSLPLLLLLSPTELEKHKRYIETVFILKPKQEKSIFDMDVEMLNPNDIFVRPKKEQIIHNPLLFPSPRIKKQPFKKEAVEESIYERKPEKQSKKEKESILALLTTIEQFYYVLLLYGLYKIFF
jgi:hypothetical protein